MFSIIIPTFNNLKYLKLCIKSIKKNSQIDNEVIFHINDGSDGTLDYIKENKFKHTHSNQNIGLCRAVNNSAKLASQKYIVYAHDDMYFCPGWDVQFKNEISKIKDEDFFLSGTMIQPFKSFIFLDCGENIEEFNEAKLLKKFNSMIYNDFQGTTWAPSLLPLKTWNKVGGFSEEYGPGLGSDPDLNMKLWKIGVRLFKGIGNCRVYHFSSLTLRKKVSNNGAKTFLLKWGISIKFFKKYYLRANEKFTGPLSEPNKDIFFYINYIKCKITYIYHLLFSKKN